MSTSHDPPITTVTCKFCGGEVRVECRPSRSDTPIWSSFDCPHCSRTSFLHVRGAVVQVSKAPQDNGGQ